MPVLPAFCKNCGNIFNSGMNVSNTIGLTIKNVSITCPKCGDYAEIPDGTYNVFDSIIHIIKGSELTRDRFRTFKISLEELRKKEVTHEEVKNTISNGPEELKSLLDILPKTRKELYLFLTFLLSALIYFSEEDLATVTNINQIINYSSEYNIENWSIDGAVEIHENYHVECPCGSGLNFRSCHGK